MTNVKTRQLSVNGVKRTVDAPANETLLETLRRIGAVEVKSGCEKGDCGACAVLLDDMAVDSCLTLTGTVGERAVTTIKGLGGPDNPHPLQTAFADLGAAQCGYCTPGFVMTAVALLEENLQPSRVEIIEALKGNICRCTGYEKIIGAVEVAAGKHAATAHATAGLQETAGG